MPIIAPERRSFSLPEEGQQQGVLAQIEVLPDEEMEFEDEKTHEMRTRTVTPTSWHFELLEEDEQGRRKTVKTKLNLSRAERSKMWAFLKDWKVTEFATNPRLDLETLVGRNALLTIAHVVSDKNGKTYANIKAILPIGPKQAPIQVRDFVPF